MCRSAHTACSGESPAGIIVTSGAFYGQSIWEDQVHETESCRGGTRRSPGRGGCVSRSTLGSGTEGSAREPAPLLLHHHEDRQGVQADLPRELCLERTRVLLYE